MFFLPIYVCCITNIEPSIPECYEMPSLFVQIMGFFPSGKVMLLILLLGKQHLGL